MQQMTKLILGCAFNSSRYLSCSIFLETDGSMDTAIAKCRPAGALHIPFLPEFTEYIVYANLDSQEEAAHNPIVEEPSQSFQYIWNCKLTKVLQSNFREDS